MSNLTNGLPTSGNELGRRTMLRAGGVLAGVAALRHGLGRGHATTRAASAARESAEMMDMHQDKVYEIEGRLLEVCTCNTLCPCWIGEDPDGGTCDSSFAYHIDQGTIEGIDVAGRTLALSVHIPGNVLAGNWKAVVYIDDESSDAQQAALLKVFTGQLGGAIADTVALIGEVIAVERAPITFTVMEGKGTLTIGEIASAELAPFTGPDGTATALHDTVFSTIPGTPAYVGKALHYRRTETAAHGLLDIDIQGQNAIQGLFHFEA